MPEDYKAQFVLSSKIKTLFVGPNGEKVRISGAAKSLVLKYLDDKVKEGVQELIDKLPKKSKGKNKGLLKRITIQAEDFD
ncbi:MAG: hypothetical protein ACTSU5_21395 [Promethearchaeota archaeon]